MCLLSYFPENILPDLTHLQNGADENPDGFGWAIVIPSEKRILTGHGMNAPAVIAEFGEMRAKYPAGPALFHSRFGTGGSVTEYNCHPFVVGRDPRTVLAHNGILGDPHGARCDTRVFAEDILPLRWKRYDRPGVRRQIEHYLGFGNKIVLLTVNPRYAVNGYIFNEDLGDWIGNVWHSNSGWKPLPAWWKYSKKSYRSTRYYPAALLGQNAKNATRALSDDDDWDEYPGDGDASGTYSDTWGKWRDCQVCYTPYSIDPETHTCTDCDSCEDCGMPSGMCDCYTPGVSAHSVPVDPRPVTRARVITVLPGHTVTCDCALCVAWNSDALVDSPCDCGTDAVPVWEDGTGALTVHECPVCELCTAWHNGAVIARRALPGRLAVIRYKASIQPATVPGKVIALPEVRKALAANGTDGPARWPGTPVASVTVAPGATGTAPSLTDVPPF